MKAADSKSGTCHQTKRYQVTENPNRDMTSSLWNNTTTLNQEQRTNQATKTSCPWTKTPIKGLQSGSNCITELAHGYSTSCMGHTAYDRRFSSHSWIWLLSCDGPAHAGLLCNNAALRRDTIKGTHCALRVVYVIGGRKQNTSSKITARSCISSL